MESHEEATSESAHTTAYLQGTLFLHRGHFEGALRCFEAALNEEAARGNSPRLVEILVSLANVNAIMGEREKARALYQRVLELQRQAPDARTVGLTLCNLGNLSRELGEPERARSYYLEAAEFLDGAGDERSMGIVQSNIGLLEEDLGNLERAAAFFKKAIDLHKKTGYEEGLAATWGQLGRNLLRQGNGRDAETCFNHACAHFSRLGDSTGEAEALRGLADVFEARNERDLACRCIRRAIEVHERLGLPVSRFDIERLEKLRGESAAG